MLHVIASTSPPAANSTTTAGLFRSRYVFQPKNCIPRPIFTSTNGKKYPVGIRTGFLKNLSAKTLKVAPYTAEILILQF